MRSLKYYILMLSFMVSSHAGLVKDNSTMEHKLLLAQNDRGNELFYKPIGMKHYQSSSGDFITFSLEISSEVEKVRTINEYIGFSFNNSLRQLNIFIDSGRMPAVLVNELTAKKYSNDPEQVRRAIHHNLNFEVRKKTLFINFVKINRASASED